VGEESLQVTYIAGRSEGSLGCIHKVACWMDSLLLVQVVVVVELETISCVEG